jgi:hypothetical protein
MKKARQWCRENFVLTFLIMEMEKRPCLISTASNYGIPIL